ncbi:tannase/feruloyl esterase family alpha/beta hydrolase [Nocardia sp. NPDC056541]|uniref:tannase/feruloyl esterase family alpha/beta hydrolase n=1 Tax=Nocardia sp. NPDC056541 TaxID=3345860 RepID=UPI0036730E6B
MEKIERTARDRWLVVPTSEPDPQVVHRCTEAVVAAALAEVSDASVVSVAINRTGQLNVPASAIGMPAFIEQDLPGYCEVVVHQQDPGGHTVEIRVWVPLTWNGRFLGTAGGGNRTTAGLMSGDEFRGATLANAVRNGFAAASTDSGVGRDPRISDWQLDESTGELDDNLIENWVHRSTHDMTVIGKAVTTAIHGATPRFSYFQGTSGGGRQAIAQARLHPADYDGVWSSDPAMNWTRLIPAELWPALVMKELDNALAPEKFEAFRQAVVDDFALRTGSPESFTTSDEPPAFDPYRLVGQATTAGPIVEADAQVMKMIWDGPRTATGEQLWFGLRPGAESWGALGPHGLCITKEEPDGRRTPDPWAIALSWFATWLQRDPEWDWRTLTFDEYERLFLKGIEEFAYLSVEDPDLSELRDGGRKLLLTHGTDDQVIFSQGSRHYFDNVIEHMGGRPATDEFARFFLCAGDGHSFRIPSGFGIDLATGMIALMNWVENGIAPDSLETLHFADDGISVAEVRSIAAYGTASVLDQQVTYRSPRHPSAVVFERK